MGKKTKSTGPNPEIFSGRSDIFNVLQEIAKGLRPLPHYIGVKVNSVPNTSAEVNSILHQITIEARTAYVTITGHSVGRDEIEVFSITAPCSPADDYDFNELTLWK